MPPKTRPRNCDQVPGVRFTLCPVHQSTLEERRKRKQPLFDRVAHPELEGVPVNIYGKSLVFYGDEDNLMRVCQTLGKATLGLCDDCTFSGRWESQHLFSLGPYTPSSHDEAEKQRLQALVNNMPEFQGKNVKVDRILSDLIVLKVHTFATARDLFKLCVDEGNKFPVPDKNIRLDGRLLDLKPFSSATRHRFCTRCWELHPLDIPYWERDCPEICAKCSVQGHTHTKCSAPTLGICVRCERGHRVYWFSKCKDPETQKEHKRMEEARKTTEEWVLMLRDEHSRLVSEDMPTVPDGQEPETPSSQLSTASHSVSPSTTRAFHSQTEQVRLGTGPARIQVASGPSSSQEASPPSSQLSTTSSTRAAQGRAGTAPGGTGIARRRHVHARRQVTSGVPSSTLAPEASPMLQSLAAAAMLVPDSQVLVPSSQDTEATLSQHLDNLRSSSPLADSERSVLSFVTAPDRSSSHLEGSPERGEPAKPDEGKDEGTNPYQPAFIESNRPTPAASYAFRARIKKRVSDNDEEAQAPKKKKKKEEKEAGSNSIPSPPTQRTIVGPAALRIIEVGIRGPAKRR